MKAIILSCDKYHPIANHMILTYEKLWPTNKLTYRIPWNNEYPKSIVDTFGDKVEPINTPLEFKKTIFGLIEDLDDDEWVFWCSDDTYLIDINEEEATKTLEFVNSLKDTEICGVTFGYIRQVPYNINKDNLIEYNGLKFVQRTKLTNQWAHQFWKVKILKNMFKYLDEAPKYQAKEMDYMLHEKNPFWEYVSDKQMYTLDHNVAIWGESTHRGNLTQNCLESFKSYNLPLPSNFETSSAIIYFK